MAEIKGIVHDWDDSVAPGFEHYKYFYIDFAAHYGLQEPNEVNLKRSWGQPIAHIAHDQWGTLSLKELEKMVADYIPLRKDSHHIELFPGVKETIRQLSAKYLLAVLSSGNLDQIMKTYQSQISSTKMYHSIIVAPPKYTVRKDHPKVLEPIMSNFKANGITPHEMVMVGDHHYDHLAAQSQGLLFIALTTGITDRQAFLESGIEDKYILDSFNKLPGLLNTLNSK